MAPHAAHHPSDQPALNDVPEGQTKPPSPSDVPTPPEDSARDESIESSLLARWARHRSAGPVAMPPEDKVCRFVEQVCAQPASELSAHAVTEDSAFNPAALVGPPQRAGDLGTLGSYWVVRELGRGGMGIALLADDPRLGRKVAIKVLRPDRADARALERLVREARAAAQLNHDHVMPVYEVQTPDAGPPYIVMPYVEGETLRQRIQHGPALDTRAIARVVREVAEGLAAVHDGRLVHRDVKPSNILLERANGRARLMDFGLVTAPTPADGVTQEGTAAGTPEYMSPEQLRDPKGIDGRSDVYSLGATMYEALTRQPPFAGAGHMVLKEVLSDEPRAPRCLDDRIPRELETICLKAMDKEPGRRYQAAREFADDLDRWLEGKPIVARPVGPAGRLWKWCRRNRAVACLAAALVVAVAVGSGAGAWLWRQAMVERHQAAEERQHADESYAAARDALDELTRLIYSPLLQSGQQEPERLEIMQKASAIHERFLDLRRNDPLYRGDRGRQFMKLGKLTMELGSIERAIVQDEQARDIFTSLAGESPADRDHRLMWATCEGELSSLYLTTGRAHNAVAAALHALSLFAKLAEETPDDEARQSDLAQSHKHLGNIYANPVVGRPADADAAYVESRQLLGRLKDRAPGVVNYRIGLVEVLVQHGVLHQEAKRYDEAERTFREALMECQALEQAPDSEQYQGNIGIVYDVLAQLYGARDRLEEAESACRQARQSFELALKQAPTVANLERLAMTCANQGIFYYDHDKWHDAEEVFQRALEIREQLAEQRPALQRYQEAVARAQLNLALTYGQQPQQRAKARDLYDAARKIWMKLLEHDGTVLRYGVGKATAEAGLGNLDREEKPADALGRYGEAIATLEPFAAAATGDTDIRQRLLDAHWAKADMLTKLKRDEEALGDRELALQYADPRDLQLLFTKAAESYLTCMAKAGENLARARRYGERAVELLRRAIEKAKPSDRDGLIRHLARTFFDLGVLVREKVELEDLEEAITWFNKAVEQLDRVEAPKQLCVIMAARADTHALLGRPLQAREDWKQAIRLGGNLDTLPIGLRVLHAQTLAHLNDPRQAAAEVDELPIADLGVHNLYLSARVYAAAAADPDNPDRERHAELAIDRLKKAIDQGFTDAASIAQEKDFDAIRGRADFEALMEKLRAEGTHKSR